MTATDRPRIAPNARFGPIGWAESRPAASVDPPPGTATEADAIELDRRKEKGFELSTACWWRRRWVSTSRRWVSTWANFRNPRHQT